MQERIEPPILISRLMTFVMATSLVVLFVLVFTLDKMFPLNRPQVFVLSTQSLEDKQLTLTEFPTDDAFLEQYNKQFILNYVRERNEITPDLAIMRAKWANSPSGSIKARSTDAVFGEFADSDMVNAVYQVSDEPFNITCTVDFPLNYPVVLQTGTTDTYTVSFSYRCSYGPMGEQQYERLVKLRIKLESTAKSAMRWVERMENPLGVRVSGYETTDGTQDPLNWGQHIEE